MKLNATILVIMFLALSGFKWGEGETAGNQAPQTTEERAQARANAIRFIAHGGSKQLASAARVAKAMSQKNAPGTEATPA